jgi:hypothetical protein
MSVKILSKLDRFYLLLAGVLLVLLLLVIITFREIIHSLTMTNKDSQKSTFALTGINKENLDKAYEMIFNKKIVSIDLIP